MMDGVQNRRRGWDHGLLTNAFRPERPYWRGIFDQDAFNRRHIPDRRYQVVVQVFTFAGEKFFHNRHAEALRHTAFDLPLNERGINGSSHIVRRHNIQDLNSAEFQVHHNLGHVRAESVDCVWSALTIGIERTRRRIEGLLAGHDITILVER
jgi:hypothetical protein